MGYHCAEVAALRNLSRRTEAACAAALFALGFALRLAALAALPAGLNQDEASALYDAWAILNYGVDRNMNALPVLLVSWGSGQNALLSYLAMPFIALLGPTVWALRLPMALSGCLLGYTLISREMQDEDLRKMVDILGYREGLPVVTDPGIIDPRAFIDEVIHKRIPNPFMPDTPQRIATDTSQKLSIRFGETIKSYLASDKLDVTSLRVVPLVYAMYLRYLLAVDDEGEAFTLSPDPMTDTLQPMLSGITLGSRGDFTQRLRPLLSNEKIFGLDVTATPLFGTVVEDFTRRVAGKGCGRATIHDVVNA